MYNVFCVYQIYKDPEEDEHEGNNNIPSQSTWDWIGKHLVFLDQKGTLGYDFAAVRLLVCQQFILHMVP